MAAILDFRSEHFSYFWCTSHPILRIKFQVNVPFSSEQEAKKKFFKMAAMETILDFSSERFLLFLSTSHPDAFFQVSSQ